MTREIKVGVVGTPEDVFEKSPVSSLIGWPKRAGIKVKKVVRLATIPRRKMLRLIIRSPFQFPKFNF
jgi:hypothetical protein